MTSTPPTPPPADDAPEHPPLQPLLAHLVAGRTLTEAQARDAFEAVMAGRATDAQIGALLAALATRPGGPTVDEITGAARAMRDHSAKVPVPPGVTVVDTCGTGGDASATFNISTTAALIAAGAGAHVAKHGNRSVTSKSGSSQVLEALGVKLGTPADNLACALEEARICFCFAPAHHPAMKHAVGPRRELGFRTIFNLLGPLTNPANAKRQVIGVYAPELTETFAAVLQQLGATHALIVHGSTPGGLIDEISTAGPTRITTLQDGSITTTIVTPEFLGVPMLDSLDPITVDSVEQSAEMVRNVLAGDHGPARDIASINAAAALVAAGLADDLPAGLQQAHAALDSGAARAALDKLVEVTHRA